jgi:hypothetical protein
MDDWFGTGLMLAAMLAALATLWSHVARKRRTAYIDQFVFPESIARKLQLHYPHLADAQARLVLEGLKEYFHVCNLAGRRMVAMPSQVVDTAWHEFIVFTCAYARFCTIATGRFLHHTPAEAMRGPRIAQDGIKRAWRASCHRAGINPKAPVRLPLLFAIDAELEIPGGFTYALDCTKDRGAAYCAGHIGCGSGCSGNSGGCGGDGGGGCGGD